MEEKAINFVLSACLLACNNSAPAGRTGHTWEQDACTVMFGTQGYKTHSEYVTCIDFRFPQWLHERVSMLCYKYGACHVITNLWIWSATVKTVPALSWIQVFWVVTLRRWVVLHVRKDQPSATVSRPRRYELQNTNVETSNISSYVLKRVRLSQSFKI
jgi:hypothetical protein